MSEAPTKSSDAHGDTKERLWWWANLLAWIEGGGYAVIAIVGAAVGLWSGDTRPLWQVAVGLVAWLIFVVLLYWITNDARRAKKKLDEMRQMTEPSAHASLPEPSLSDDHRMHDRSD